MKHFDVVVVGGGHAGVEAAHAAARMGALVALVTLRRSAIGVMSCNPAIGGLGKGHLVREIDALDGLMGRAADLAGIQFRLLNRRKGPAVQGPRAQADRALYRSAIQQFLRATPAVTVIEGEVADLRMMGRTVSGVVLSDGVVINSRVVVLTTGTFLRGVIHIGDQRREGGRMGEDAAVALAQRIESLGLPLGRLKTGTPPRIDGRTIRWGLLEMQPGDADPVMFSFLSRRPAARQISCGITETNETTHEIIRGNLHRSAIYGGHIGSVGPRYCPSIEDKVVRFSEKASHQIFLEPEGLDDHTVYPNGISTSLPAEVQEAYVRSIRGLECAEIVQPGYAIEYDYVDPRALDPDLSVRDFPGLFLAGQINGTTGYEEAAAQGMVAGINAVRQARTESPVYFSRADSYIGVMVDDLVTRGVAEPYRMFTSRAEFRLSLRADNADQRLTPVGLDLGCISDVRRDRFVAKRDALSVARSRLGGISITPNQLIDRGIGVSRDGGRRSGMEVLALPEGDYSILVDVDPSLSDVPPEIRQQLCREAIYANYIERQRADVAALRRDDGRVIPDDFRYDALQGLSHEVRDKLSVVRPRTLGQAARIEGVTPAALTLVLAHLRLSEKRRAAG